MEIKFNQQITNYIIASQVQVQEFQLYLIIKMNVPTTSPSKLTAQKFRHSISTLQSSHYRNSLDFTPGSQSLFYSCSDKEIKERKSLNTKNAQKIALMLDQYQEEKEASSLFRLKSSLTQIEQKLKKAKSTLKTSQSLTLSQDLNLQRGAKHVKNDKTSYKNDETSTIQSLPGRDQFIPNNFKSKSKNQKKYYLSDIFQAIKGTNSRYLDHLNLSLNVFKNLSAIKPPTFAQIHQRRLRLPRRPQDQGKPTLVLDIDETLIHCQENPSLNFDTILPIETANGSIAQAFIGIRPYTVSFLKKMSKHFEIISFTASHQSYADVVLDAIDPNHEYIRHRLYRKHCIQVYENLLVKDLRIIDRDLSKMVLVDNAPYSYIFQPENGIPILPFYQGEDSELYKLQKYLMQLLKCGDMREENKRVFQFHRYNQFEYCNEVANKLYFSQI